MLATSVSWSRSVASFKGTVEKVRQTKHLVKQFFSQLNVSKGKLQTEIDSIWIYVTEWALIIPVFCLVWLRKKIRVSRWCEGQTKAITHNKTVNFENLKLRDESLVVHKIESFGWYPFSWFHKINNWPNIFGFWFHEIHLLVILSWGTKGASNVAMVMEKARKFTIHVCTDLAVGFWAGIQSRESWVIAVHFTWIDFTARRTTQFPKCGLRDLHYFTWHGHGPVLSNDR